MAGDELAAKGTSGETTEQRIGVLVEISTHLLGMEDLKTLERVLKRQRPADLAET